MFKRALLSGPSEAKALEEWQDISDERGS